MAKIISIDKRIRALEAISAPDDENCAADFVTAAGETVLRQAMIEANVELEKDPRLKRWPGQKAKRLKLDDERRVGDPLHWPFSALTAAERDAVRQAIMQDLAR